MYWRIRNGLKLMADTNNIKAINVEALLAEYQQLRSEIEGYFKARTSILAIVISATGVILGFTQTNDPIFSLLAIHIIINIGALLTYAYTYQAQKRASYVKVFIESKISELNWYSALNAETIESPGIYKFLRKIGLPLDGLPHEYPMIYILLFIIAIMFSLILFNRTGFHYIITTMIISTIIFIYNIVALQDANSAFRFRKLIDEWEIVKKNVIMEEIHE